MGQMTATPAGIEDTWLEIGGYELSGVGRKGSP